MNSGESYVVTEDNWWRDEPQSRGSRILRWVLGITGMIILAAVLLFVSLMIGSIVFVCFVSIIGAMLAPLAFTLGGLACIACLFFSGALFIALLHPLHNWIHDRIDVLVID